MSGATVPEPPELPDEYCGWGDGFTEMACDIWFEAWNAGYKQALKDVTTTQSELPYGNSASATEQQALTFGHNQFWRP